MTDKLPLILNDPKSPQQKIILPPPTQSAPLALRQGIKETEKTPAIFAALNGLAFTPAQTKTIDNTITNTTTTTAAVTTVPLQQSITVSTANTNTLSSSNFSAAPNKIVSFVKKVYEMVNDPTIDGLISWNYDKSPSSFIVCK